MRGTILLFAILVAVLGAGCAGTVDVVVDEREDLSPHRTWDWSPHARSNVAAPHGDAAALDARLARLIGQSLLANGFQRARGRADFFVTYRLGLRRRAVVVNQPRAAYELSSLHSSGSYLIEGSERVTRVYMEIHLAVGVTGARGRTLWHAELAQRAEDIFALKLEEAVALLFERFPRHRPRNGTEEPRQRRSICDDPGSPGEIPRGRGVRDGEGDSPRESQPDGRCPGEGLDPDGPRPDPRPPPPEPGGLA